MGQLELFDYGALAPPLARSLQERAERIAGRERGVIDAILANGREFCEAREELRHNKTGGFEGWYTLHGWKRATVYNYIQAWEQFGNLPTVAQLAIAPSALYLLAAPSTPESAREEALARAEAGEPVSYSAAQEIVAEAKEAEEEAGQDGPTQQELWGSSGEEGGGFASHLDGCESPEAPTPEEGYRQGRRASAVERLYGCLRELGVDDPEAGKAAWVVEREETVAALRRVCAAHGDLDWDEGLYIPDVIEKHLENHLDDPEGR
jgi:hypothetical protein